ACKIQSFTKSKFHRLRPGSGRPRSMLCDLYFCNLCFVVSMAMPSSESEPVPPQRTRLSIPEYAMALAHVASLRSEDPFRKVGAVAFDFDNRVIGTAYNGLAPGFNAKHE